MAFAGKVVLFVEGSKGGSPRGRLPLDEIWKTHLVRALRLPGFDRVVPISKKDVTALNPMGDASGVGAVPLDVRITVEVEAGNCDAVVVAWDIQPPWDHEIKPHCKSDELMWFYEGLAASHVLPDRPWKRWVETRHALLQARTVGIRGKPSKIQRGAVLAVIMEPTFESLLMACEGTVRTILGVGRQEIVDWPRWDAPGRLPEDILFDAIEAARRRARQSVAFRAIRGDMVTHKNDWAEYLLRMMLEDEACREAIRKHPIAARLASIMT